MHGLQRPEMHLSLLRSRLYILPHSHSNFFLLRCFGGFCYIKAAMGSLAEATLALLFVYYDSIDYDYNRKEYKCKMEPAVVFEIMTV